MDIKVYTRKRGTGYQYIVSYKVAGAWRTKSKQGFRTAAEAKRAGNAIAVDLSDFVPQTGICPTFKSIALLMHLDGRKAISTVKSYKSYLETFEPIHDKPIDQIGYADITPILQEYQATHKHNGLKAIHRYGGSVFRFAKKLKHVRDNPFDDYNLTAPKKSDKRESVIMSKAEIIALANKAPAEIAAIIAIQGLCGLRISEVLGLRRSDIADGQITVKQQRKHGNPNAELKTSNSYRTVPLAPAVLPYLKALPVRFDGRLFNLTSSPVERFLSARGLVSHDLRHSYATNLIGMGVDFKTTAEFLGDSVEMVMRVYSHVSVDMRTAAAQKILENF